MQRMLLRDHSRWMLGLTLCAVLSMAMQLQAQPRYTITDLSPVGVHDINASGLLTGGLPQDLWETGMVYVPVTQALDGELKVLFNSYLAFGAALNDLGAVVAVEEIDEVSSRPVYWSEATGAVPMSMAWGHTVDWAHWSINNTGQIAGTLVDVFNQTVCPAQWASPTSEPACLITPAVDVWGRSLAQNAAGVVVGVMGTSAGEVFPFQSGPETGTEIYDLPGERFVGITDDGVILGQSGTLYYPTGRIQEIPGLPGCTAHQAHTLNRRLDVVGRSTCRGIDRAWIWRKGVGIFDLTTLVGDPSWLLTWPLAINDDGLMVGDGYHHGLLTSWRLVPVYDPPTLAISLNQTQFVPGQTLRVTLAAEHPSPLVIVDLYFGVLLPDGVTMLFLTSFSPLQGVTARLDGDPRYFAPLLTNIPLPQGFDVTLQDFWTYTFTGTEAPASYHMLAAFTGIDAFTDGSVDTGDVLAITLAPFTFTQASTTDLYATMRMIQAKHAKVRAERP